MGTYFFESWVPGALLWAALYVSDYYCTIASARLYREGANQHIVFEGSFELNPFLQKDVDALRRVSPRFLIVLVAYVGVLAYLWFTARWIPEFAPGYELCLGSLILSQCFIHMRHFRNLFLFRALRAGGGGLTGRLEHHRPFVLRASAAEALSFAGMYLLLSAILMSWFFLGGGLSCLVLVVYHRRLARRHAKQAPSAAPS